MNREEFLRSREEFIRAQASLLASSKHERKSQRPPDLSVEEALKCRIVQSEVRGAGIRAMEMAGHSRLEIAHAFGVSRNSVLTALRPHNTKHVAAHIACNEAIKAGTLVRPDKCERCGGNGGKGAIHGHHPDYDKPLEVQWLCSSCHSKEHARQKLTKKLAIGDQR